MQQWCEDRTRLTAVLLQILRHGFCTWLPLGDEVLQQSYTCIAVHAESLFAVVRLLLCSTPGSQGYANRMLREALALLTLPSPHRGRCSRSVTTANPHTP